MKSPRFRAASGAANAPPLYREALVVFSGNSDIWWLGWLKAGFRHCFIAFNDGRHWITLDPLSHRTEVMVQDVPADFDLRAFYEAQGMRCVTAALAPTPMRCAPPGPFTCVEAVKRALGLRAPLVWTPRQLYRRLSGRPGKRSGRQPAEGRDISPTEQGPERRRGELLPDRQEGFVLRGLTHDTPSR